MPALYVVAVAAFALVGCQDSYASNSERDTHMGAVRAAPTGYAVSSATFADLPPVVTPGLEHPVRPMAPLAPDAGAVRLMQMGRASGDGGAAAPPKH